MKFVFAIFLVFSSSKSFSQMTHSSIFPDMKSLNPAVISVRPAATLGINIKNDKSEKSQDLGKKYGAGSSSTETGVITSNNFSYGGKGGGITLEALADISKGELDFEFDLKNQTQGESSFSGDAESQFFGIGLGVSEHFGVSFAHSNIKVKSSFSATIDTGGGSGSEEVNTNDETSISVSRVKVGLRGNLGLDYGLYYEAQVKETEQDVPSGSFPEGEAPDAKTTENTSTVGVGIGHKTTTFHAEVFFEKRLEDIEGQGDTVYSPARYGGTIEGKLFGLTLGYTGMYFVDGFSDLERTLYDSLILSNSLYEARLENTINFSFGGEKGHSFGGSFFQTTIENEETTKVDSETKFPTTTTVQGITLNYKYSF